MSAFMCSEDHIGALVRYIYSHDRYGSAELRGRRIMNPNGWDHNQHAIKNCSNEAFVDWRDVFAELSTENALSINARYGDNHEECRVDTLHVVTPKFKSVYRYRELTAIEAIKCAQCFEYQACEHDGWEKSDAKRLIDHIINIAIHLLPGYDAAPWGI